jgi:hypothetical protein
MCRSEAFMDIEVIFKDVRFHKVVNILEKENCGVCSMFEVCCSLSGISNGGVKMAKPDIGRLKISM